MQKHVLIRSSRTSCNLYSAQLLAMESFVSGRIPHDTRILWQCIEMIAIMCPQCTHTITKDCRVMQDSQQLCLMQPLQTCLTKMLRINLSKAFTIARFVQIKARYVYFKHANVFAGLTALIE